MTTFNYPHHDGWEPRAYQRPVWDYMSQGGRHAELIWHRRAGKDDIALRHTGCEMLETPANYWHMLPQANQVRKAIWEAVNPHTGKRRIDEAFPDQLFNKRNTDMFIQCKINASTWQCLGSDNYEGAIGSTPKGIVYSEWALANPSVRGYLRPIIRENNGWQMFITTPRGKNHAFNTFKGAQGNPKAFAERLTVYDTGMLTPAELMEELLDYGQTYGEEQGLALFEQEYECSWDAALLGAYYGAEFTKIDREGRIDSVSWNPKYPVHVAMDIGRSDDTSMWFFQAYGGRLWILEHYANNFKDPDHYIGVITGKDCQLDIVDKKLKVNWGKSNRWEYHQDWNIQTVFMPHDAKAKTFAATKSAEEQFAAAFGWGSVEITPNLSLQDGIQATRKALSIAVFDGQRCESGLDSLRSYHREWDDTKKKFRDTPMHDWSSHDSDGFRYLAVAWSEDRLPPEDRPVRWKQDRTIDEIVQNMTRKRLRSQKHR